MIWGRLSIQYLNHLYCYCNCHAGILPLETLLWSSFFLLGSPELSQILINWCICLSNRRWSPLGQLWKSHSRQAAGWGNTAEFSAEIYAFLNYRFEYGSTQITALTPCSWMAAARAASTLTYCGLSFWWPDHFKFWTFELVSQILFEPDYARSPRSQLRVVGPQISILNCSGTTVYF